VVGALALILVVLLSLYSRGIAGEVETAAIVSVLAVTVVSWATVNVLQRQHRVLADVRTVAETAQHVLLRDVPPELGSVRAAIGYQAAAAEARIGGDLYEAVMTRYGDRLIIGDVRGKGLPAVEAAADVLGIFREAAHQEPSLSAVAERLHEGLARRHARDEDFVTAVLISIPTEGEMIDIVNCGHPPPLLLHYGRVTALDPPEPGLPLGLFDLAAGRCVAHAARFEPGDSILLYTDGTTEARDSTGEFYPLEEDLAWADFDGPDGLVDLVLMGLRKHAGARLDDDVALVAVERLGAWENH
jgi:serine phosphatase RsbU (regulator of sigma subunit)